MTTEKRRALVTGGAGFIGSTVADAFLAEGHEVTVLDNLASGKREQVPAKARFVEADIRSPEAAACIRDGAFDVVCHLAAKLALSDGMRVLDIGSGWGGLALYLAKTAHVDVTGITLSEEQLKIARERAGAEGLSKAVNFELCDYRNLEGTFDRIVSVGMFGHVGSAHYRSFFQQVNRLLKDDGVAVIHSIGRFDGPAATNPFIAKYIFPGGYIPALSEVVPAVEREGLLATDLEILRLHYAMTLRQWRQRFRASWHTAAEKFGERFCRMWEMYLAGSETAFRYKNLRVSQIHLTRDQNALPLTRDYMFDAERELRASDRQPSASRKKRTSR